MSAEPVRQRHREEMDAFNPAHAVITQVGRWKYRIHISHGLSMVANEWGGPYRYGRERAEKYARKWLAKYVRDRERRENTREIRL